MANVVTSLLDGMKRDFPDWQEGLRPSHTTGISAIGTFRGTPEAQRFCGAEHFDTDWTPVTVRFSNSVGQPSIDASPDVRGMAVKFHTGCELPKDEFGGMKPPSVAPDGGRETDLVCISAPMFVVPTAERLVGFMSS